MSGPSQTTHLSKVLERQTGERERKRSFWSKLRMSRSRQTSTGMQTQATTSIKAPQVVILPNTPKKQLPARPHLRHASSSSLFDGANSLSGTVFTHTPNTLSLSMPPSMSMAFTRSTSSNGTAYSAYSPPGRQFGSMGSGSLLEIRRFAEKLENLNGGNSSSASLWADLTRSTTARRGETGPHGRPGIAPWVRDPSEQRGRQNTTLSGESGPALSYGQTTTSSASLLSADWSRSATTLCSDTSEVPATGSTSQARIKDPLHQARSPMMMAVPSSSGKSVTAEFGTSLGVGAFGSMILMDAYDAGYLGSTGANQEGEVEFAQAVEARLKEIMGITE